MDPHDDAPAPPTDAPPTAQPATPAPASTAWTRVELALLGVTAAAGAIALGQLISLVARA